MPPPIQIKRGDVARDVRLLADILGITLTDAIAKAVGAQLAIERVKANAKLAKRMREATRALAELQRMPVVGPELTDEDLYDREGMPR